MLVPMTAVRTKEPFGLLRAITLFGRRWLCHDTQSDAAMPDCFGNASESKKRLTISRIAIANGPGSSATHDLGTSTLRRLEIGAIPGCVSGARWVSMIAHSSFGEVPS